MSKERWHRLRQPKPDELVSDKTASGHTEMLIAMKSYKETFERKTAKRGMEKKQGKREFSGWTERPQGVARRRPQREKSQ